MKKLKNTLKNAVTVLAVILSAQTIQAQERSSWFNYHFYQTGNYKYTVTDANGAVTAEGDYPLKHLTLQYNYTTEDWYMHAQAFGPLVYDVIAQPNPKNVAGHWFEGGWGWFLNKKKPIRLGSNADILYGAGIDMGVYQLGRGCGIHYSSVAYIGPTFAANFQLSDKLNIHNTFKLAYART